MFTDAPPAAALVDLRRYLGRWFEIARLPVRFEPDDCSNVTAEYARRDDGAIHVRGCCTLRDGRTHARHGLARTIDGSHARLEVNFMPPGLRWLPFAARDYWILLVDDGYTLSLVGTPNRRRLWLLSRVPHPSPALRDGYLAHAESLGYDLTPLIHTPQAHAQDSTARH